MKEKIKDMCTLLNCETRLEAISKTMSKEAKRSCCMNS
jgi:hypothetical protein